MRLLQRNLKTFSYCLFLGEVTLLDADGIERGTVLTYAEPVELKGNVSPSQGQAQMEMFGNADFYSKVLVLDDVNLPINESSVLFIDKVPEFKGVNSFKIDPETAEIVPVIYLIPLYDYVVKRVAKSLNVAAYAVDKVDVGYGESN